MPSEPELHVGVWIPPVPSVRISRAPGLPRLPRPRMRWMPRSARSHLKPSASPAPPRKVREGVGGARGRRGSTQSRPPRQHGLDPLQKVPVSSGTWPSESALKSAPPRRVSTGTGTQASSGRRRLRRAYRRAASQSGPPSDGSSENLLAFSFQESNHRLGASNGLTSDTSHRVRTLRFAAST